MKALQTMEVKNNTKSWVLQKVEVQNIIKSVVLVGKLAQPEKILSNQHASLKMFACLCQKK